jgi:hypothetical protein
VNLRAVDDDDLSASSDDSLNDNNNNNDNEDCATLMTKKPGSETLDGLLLSSRTSSAPLSSSDNNDADATAFSFTCPCVGTTIDVSRRTRAVAIICLTTLFMFADQNLMAPNLTDIARDFGFTDDERDEKLGGDSGCSLSLIIDREQPPLLSATTHNNRSFYTHTNVPSSSRRRLLSARRAGVPGRRCARRPHTTPRSFVRR